MKTIGLLLAGGQGTRMGSSLPKPLLRIGERTIAARVLDRLRDHVDEILVSANLPDAYAHLGLRVIPDRLPGQGGPVAGLHAAFQALVSRYGGSFRIMSAPGDTPFLPASLVPRLAEAAEKEVTAVAIWRDRLQPTCALWTYETLSSIVLPADFSGRSPSLNSIIEGKPFTLVPFDDDERAPGGNPFFNVNTPDDLECARRWVDALNR